MLTTPGPGTAPRGVLSPNCPCLCLQGRTFIDRDPAHFGLILNFLRDGTCVLPITAQGLQELLQEAEFYQVWLVSSYHLATQVGPS